MALARERPQGETDSPAATGATRKDVAGLTLEALEAAVVAEGLEAFRARQIWRWVWRHGVTRFGDMTDLAKPVRETLSQRFMVSRPRITRRMQSGDGTVKWLLRFADGNEAETVYIPEDDRGTLCISSQVGCTLTCTFCRSKAAKVL